MARAVSLILVPIAIYAFFFYLHFAILVNSGTGDSTMRFASFDLCLPLLAKSHFPFFQCLAPSFRPILMEILSDLIHEVYFHDLVIQKEKDKTRQDKTRQDKTRQDKTRQDKTRQNETKQRNCIRINHHTSEQRLWRRFVAFSSPNISHWK